MIVLRWLVLAACFGCFATVAWNGRWQGRLTRANHTWIVDLGRSPVWAPPTVPEYAKFKEVFKESKSFPDDHAEIVIRRIPKLDWMALDLLLYLWGVTMVGGLLYLAVRNERRELILHCGLSVAAGLTVAAVACIGLWLLFGGWGPPAPVFFGGIGVIVGLVGGLASYERVVA